MAISHANMSGTKKKSLTGVVKRHGVGKARGVVLQPTVWERYEKKSLKGCILTC